MLHKIIDTIATFFGSVKFLALSTIAFAIWILVNTVAPKSLHFDPYPFNFFTFSVSIEAIYLSIFVLISQNRQGERDRQRMEADHELNIKEEQEQCEMLTILANQNTAQDEHQRMLSESHAILQEVRELVAAKRARKN